jgi:hypothetical protein
VLNGPEETPLTGGLNGPEETPLTGGELDALGARCVEVLRYVLVPDSLRGRGRDESGMQKLFEES